MDPNDRPQDREGYGTSSSLEERATGEPPEPETPPTEELEEPDHAG